MYCCEPKMEKIKIMLRMWRKNREMGEMCEVDCIDVFRLTRATVLNVPKESEVTMTTRCREVIICSCNHNITQ